MHMMDIISCRGFVAEDHVRGPLLGKVLRGLPLTIMIAPRTSPSFNKSKAEAGLVTNQHGRLFVIGLTYVDTFKVHSTHDPQNPLSVTSDVERDIAQLKDNNDVDVFFRNLRETGRHFINPPIKGFHNLLTIAQQGQHGSYNHPNKLLSDLATDPVPRETQNAFDLHLDNLAHHLVVTKNFRPESDYTEEENADLETYYITSHAALWAFNLTFAGTERPATSRVRLPPSAWIDWQA